MYMCTYYGYCCAVEIIGQWRNKGVLFSYSSRTVLFIKETQKNKHILTTFTLINENTINK